LTNSFNEAEWLRNGGRGFPGLEAFAVVLNKVIVSAVDGDALRFFILLFLLLLFFFLLLLSCSFSSSFGLLILWLLPGFKIYPYGEQLKQKCARSGAGVWGLIFVLLFFGGKSKKKKMQHAKYLPFYLQTKNT
jgi:hypothetical protein